MGDIRWYKRDPDAALNGMAMLTLEECGAYNLVLDLIYSREGNLPDDDRSIARWIRCDVRVWRRIRKRLMYLGKLYVHGGMLHNGRSDKEIYAAQHRLALQATLAQKSKKSPTKTTLKSSTSTTRIERKRTGREIEVGAVDNSAQVAEKRSAEQARDEAIRGMRARRKT